MAVALFPGVLHPTCALSVRGEGGVVGQVADKYLCAEDGAGGAVGVAITT